MKRSLLSLIIGALLIVIFALLLFVFQVRQSEVAVVTTFGKPTRHITEPGPYFKLPWPIQMVHRFDQRVQNFEDRLSESQTREHFNVLTSVYVGWKITNATVFFPKFAGSREPIAEAERGLERLLGQAKTAVVGKHLLSDFVSASDNGTNFLTIEAEILAMVQSQVSSNNYGLSVEFLGLKKLQLPESVTQTVFGQMTSERKKLTESLQSEGERVSQTIRSDAERRAAEVLADAAGEALRIRGQGEAEAAKSIQVFQKNPELAHLLFRFNALEDSMKERSILVFDYHTPPFDVLRGVLSTNLLNK